MLERTCKFTCSVFTIQTSHEQHMYNNQIESNNNSRTKKSIATKVSYFLSQNKRILLSFILSTFVEFFFFLILACLYFLQNVLKRKTEKRNILHDVLLFDHNFIYEFYFIFSSSVFDASFLVISFQNRSKKNNRMTLATQSRWRIESDKTKIGQNEQMKRKEKINEMMEYRIKNGKRICTIFTHLHENSLPYTVWRTKKKERKMKMHYHKCMCMSVFFRLFLYLFSTSFFGFLFEMRNEIVKTHHLSVFLHFKPSFSLWIFYLFDYFLFSLSLCQYQRACRYS